MSNDRIYGGWQREFIGRSENVIFYPDANANYWLFKMNREDLNKNIGLRVKGTFPNSRYMSINVYNDKKFTPTNCLKDMDIVPVKDCSNPFKEMGNDQIGINRYIVDVIPEGFKSDHENVLTYDEELGKIAIILRYYLPEKDDFGGVDLPVIEAFDLKTGEMLTLPELVSKKMRPRRVTRRAKIRYGVRGLLIKNFIRPAFLLNRGTDLKSYHFSGNTMYPNKDNNYLIMPMKIREGEVAVIKFRAPKLSKVNSEGDVRYYSIGQGDDESYNLLTLCDEELEISDDGYIYVVIGRESEIENTDTINFMKLKTSKKMILIYRNLVTRDGYEGNMEKVPIMRESKRMSADNFIGEYSPIGKIISVDEFKRVAFEAIK